MLAYGILRLMKSSATLKRAWCGSQIGFALGNQRKIEVEEVQISIRGDTYALSVRCRLAIDLVPAEDDEVRLLLVQDGADEFRRLGIRLASPALGLLGLDVSTGADAGAHV